MHFRQKSLLVLFVVVWAVHCSVRLLWEPLPASDRTGCQPSLVFGPRGVPQTCYSAGSCCDPVIGGALAASMLVTVIQEALSDWRSLRAIDKFTVSAQLLLSTALLLLALSTSGGAWNITQAVVFHQGVDGLQQHWEWYHHGRLTVFFLECIVAFVIIAKKHQHFQQVLLLHTFDGHCDQPEMLLERSDDLSPLMRKEFLKCSAPNQTVEQVATYSTP